ncbi:MAG: hypothetical protein ABEL51_11450 [Salinibacter sp.]
MSQLEYLVALISIIVGLALTDLAQSFRELIRPGHAVKWDGLPLAWSAFVFVITILLWWQGFTVLEEPGAAGGAGPFFLTFLLFFLLLYLCCAFALPDPDWKRSSSRSEPAGPSEAAGSPEATGSPEAKASSEYQIDLEAFYFSPEHRRWFFGLLIGFWVALMVADQLTFESGGLAQRLRSVLPVVGLSVITAVPILTDRRWAHWIVVVMLGGLIGAEAVRDILL